MAEGTTNPTSGAVPSSTTTTGAGTGLASHPLTRMRAPSRPGILASMLRQRLALTGAIIVVFFSLVAIIGPWVAPYDPVRQDIPNRFQGPSAAHWLGTDEFGRDIFSRLLHGAGISFQVGVIAVGISGLIGIVLGLIAGYRGGAIDAIISLVMDVLFAFPAILLAIAIIAMLGSSLTNVMLAIGIVNAPTFMRVVRGSVLSVRQSLYVEAAVSTGVRTEWIMIRHIFPNITGPLIVHASLNFAFAVLAEASLAYLGLGNRPPSPSWGLMVSSGYNFLRQTPWPAVAPGVAIALVVLGFNLLGDGLRDALDPRLRGQAAKSGQP